MRTKAMEIAEMLEAEEKLLARGWKKESCPGCGGCGTIPEGPAPGLQTCRKCNGEGILWVAP